MANLSSPYLEYPIMSSSRISLNSNLTNSSSSNLVSDGEKGSIHSLSSMDADSLNQLNSSKSIYLNSPTIYTLDSIILKLTNNDEPDSNITQIFESVSSFFDSSSEDFEKLKLFLQHSDSGSFEENKLELVTVVSIIKVSKELDSILSLPFTQDSYKKSYALLISLIGMFKYHFQLPNNHPNYAFKNFGSMLCNDATNILKPFLHIMLLAPPFEQIRSDKLEKTFTLLFIFHFFNRDLFFFLQNKVITDTSFRKHLSEAFKFDNFKDVNPNGVSDFDSTPSFVSVYQRFRSAILLEQSTFLTDFKFDNLLNSIFFSSIHKRCLFQIIDQLDSIHTSFSNLKIKSDQSLKEIILFAYTLINNRNNFIDCITICCVHDVEILSLLENVSKVKTPSKEKDAAMFSLLKILYTILSNFDLLNIENPNLQNMLLNYNNHHFREILGVKDTKYEFKVNSKTLIPIFELIDHNFKLNYLSEKNLLEYLKISLVNINSHLKTMDDFAMINSELVDIGCSLSIHSLFDTVQCFLAVILNRVEFQNIGLFNQIPNSYIEQLGFNLIPPVGRADFLFENNFNIIGNNFGPLFKIFEDTENSQIFKEIVCRNLLKDCLTYSVSIRSKIYQFLNILNNETNVLRVPNASSSIQNDEYQLYKYRQNCFTRIGMFRSGRTLDFKLMNPEIGLCTIANLSLFILSENYRILKNTFISPDSSLSRLFTEFSIDSFFTFILIYQEFGLLNMFKYFRDLNQENIKLILPSANIISRLFPMRANENNSLDNTLHDYVQASILKLVSDIVYKSVIASNLIRQFVELFDDGQSKSFKALNKFLKSHPSTLKPSKIPKGMTTLNVKKFVNILGSTVYYS